MTEFKKYRNKETGKHILMIKRHWIFWPWIFELNKLDFNLSEYLTKKEAHTILKQYQLIENNNDK